MMVLTKVLTDLQKFLGGSEYSLIIDGRFATYKASLIYVQTINGYISYYIKTSHDNVMERVTLSDHVMQGKYDTTSFCGKHYPFITSATPENLNVIVDPDLRIIFVETFMYKKIRQMVESDTYHDATMLIKSADSMIPNSVVIDMVNQFKNCSYRNYLETAYTNKFLNRIYKVNGRSFYSVLHCFVPVLIECKYLYNPLTDNPAINFKGTRLYREAEARERRFEALPEGVLTATLATHNEICDSLGMDYMVRFTPQFLYELITGFYNQGNVDFPNLNTKVLRATSRNYADYGLRPYYSRLQMANIMDSLKQGTEEHSKEAIEFLESYVESDSLWCGIDKYRLKLIHYGASMLDNKKNCTTNALYNYLAKAALF